MGVPTKLLSCYVAHGAASQQRQHRFAMPNTPSPRNADRVAVASAGRRPVLWRRRRIAS